VGATEKVYFFFLSGAKKGKIEAAPIDAPVRIGRQHDCQIQLDPYEDIPASGDHAQITVGLDGSFYLEDRGSSWGTFKNDVPVVGKVSITTGDVITLGHDDTGKVGPKIKFYLEKDVLRCPACEGPVYKRHFKCPVCARKYCLRCIDFKSKTCQPCGKDVVPAKPPKKPGAPALPADSGFEVVEDDDDVGEAKRPARVVVSGKDKQRFIRAQEKEKGKPDEKKKSVKKTKDAMPVDPGVIAEPVDLDAPFCAICCEFADAPVFTCPACRQTVCTTHKRGAVCPPCAGVNVAAAADVTRASEPELAVPDLDDDEAPRTLRRGAPAPAPAPTVARGVEGSGKRSMA
jgi:hypothetical protein